MLLIEAKYALKEAQKAFNTCKEPALKRHYARQVASCKARLDRYVRNDSADKPMRTPWKRLPSRYFEEL